MRRILILTALLLLSGPAQAGITAQPWGVTADDARPAKLYRLSNAHGMVVTISNYGGVIVSLVAPDRKNHFANVVQGFDTLADYTSADYIAANGHYGSIIGRFANRIKDARITLDGKVHQLDPDKNGDLDQGGRMAYFRQVWDATTNPGEEPSLILHHIDPDGYMGFPGRVDVTVTYTLTRDNRLRIDYRAMSDKKTVINLINHSYFSLAGPGPGTIDNESLQLFADAYTPISEGKVPTGEIRPVIGTDFDFTNPTVIGPRFASHDPQMAHGGGLDHNFVIRGAPGDLRIAARLSDPGSGRILEVWTTQPGMQVYSANSVRPAVAKARGWVPHGAISFQTQHYPDSPNHPNFPSTELVPGHVFHEVTEFRFFSMKTER